MFPEASVTDETSNKQLKQEHKNPETLSMLLKNITSKKEERVQVLNLEGIGLKPRTRLRGKMQKEMELVHIPKNRNEDRGDIVMEMILSVRKLYMHPKNNTV